MELLINLTENSITVISGIIILIGFLATFGITNLLVKKIVLKGKENSDVDGNGTIDAADKKLLRDGKIIGKCENIIILTFVLVGELTGLALIFAAKSIVRQKQIEENAEFYLSGTMVNFTTSLVIAFILKHILTIIQ